MNKLIEKIKQKSKEKEISRELNDYPCSYYLHNALEFIVMEEPKEAYEEICNAIIRSGGSLTETEIQKRKELWQK